MSCIFRCCYLDLIILVDYWQVGKGLSKDSKAQKLAFQHWIEAVSLLSFLVFLKIIFNSIEFFWFII